MAYFRNKERVLKVLKRLPAAIKAEAKIALDQEAEEVVAAMKRACPVGHVLEQHPGDLRDSIHAYDGHRALKSGGVRAELLKTILADAKDRKGNFVGPHVEFGHLMATGGHVPAHPWFFPTWRIQRDGLKRRLRAAGRAACKKIAPGLLR